MGCTSIKTQFTAAEEPTDGDRARLRVISNTWVKAAPNRSCLDLSAPGAGTIFGGVFGSSGYKGRSLNMPGLKNKKDEVGELYVAGDKPITLELMTTPEGVGYKGRAYSCSVVGSFTPQKNKDYEAKLILDPVAERCTIAVVELGAVNQPVQVMPAEYCN